VPNATPRTILQDAGLGDTVWIDANKNGAQDPGEVPVAGVAVALFQNGVQVAATQTDRTGFYSFTGLTPGVPYTLSFALPDGYAWTRQGANPTSATDSNVNPQDGTTDPVTLSNAEFNPTIDAGLIAPLQLVKLSRASDGGPVVNADNLVTYTLEVRNTSSQIVSNVLITDPLPGTLSYISGSAEPVPSGLTPLTWRFASLAPNEIRTIVFSARVVASIPQVIRNTAYLARNEVPVMLAIVDTLPKPTSIELAYLRAERGTEGMRVTWRTGSEANTLGFHVYRSSDGTRESAVRITTDMVLARDASGSGYQYLDTSAEPGQRYSYWLRETELSGRVLDYGPLTVPSATPQVSLPADELSAVTVLAPGGVALAPDVLSPGPAAEAGRPEAPAPQVVAPGGVVVVGEPVPQRATAVPVGQPTAAERARDQGQRVSIATIEPSPRVEPVVEASAARQPADTAVPAATDSAAVREPVRNPDVPAAAPVDTREEAARRAQPDNTLNVIGLAALAFALLVGLLIVAASAALLLRRRRD
jgi:uncharacterized repeat protein (TIGR01451 family)